MCSRASWINSACCASGTVEVCIVASCELSLCELSLGRRRFGLAQGKDLARRDRAHCHDRPLWVYRYASRKNRGIGHEHIVKPVNAKLSVNRTHMFIGRGVAHHSISTLGMCGCQSQVTQTKRIGPDSCSEPGGGGGCKRNVQPRLGGEHDPGGTCRDSYVQQGGK